MNLKSPLFIVGASMFILFMILLFAFLFEIVIPGIAMSMIGLGFFVGCGLIYYILTKDDGEEEMKAAMKFSEEWWESEFHEQLKRKGSSGYLRFYPPDPTAFYGFIYDRASGERVGISMAMVVKKLENSRKKFTVAKYRELAPFETVNGDPFVVMST